MCREWNKNLFKDREDTKAINIPLQIDHYAWLTRYSNLASLGSKVLWKRDNTISNLFDIPRYSKASIQVS